LEFEDEARFLRSWFERPLTTGAVAPSGKALAAKMASYVDPTIPGPIIEIGPGTGPVTQALIDRGCAEERLTLVEFSADFCRLLLQRFPKARVIQGDAYQMARTLNGLMDEPAIAVVSSLPLLTKPEAQRLRLLADAFSLMRPNCPFVQFTYMRTSPIPLVGGFESDVSGRIWKNLPPARVWTYRRAES
jgi:phosphatidylethanolamine/phosphatidyl-N-methylethanolamine N-methyltransferase